MRINTPKCYSLEQKKRFIAEPCKETGVAKTLKILELPTEFQQSAIKNQVRKGVMQGRGSASAEFSDWLMVGTRVVSQGLTLAVLRLQ